MIGDVRLDRLRRDHVIIATSQIALQILGHASAEERVRIARKDLQCGLVVSNGCVVTLQFQTDEATSREGAGIIWPDAQSLVAIRQLCVPKTSSALIS